MVAEAELWLASPQGPWPWAGRAGGLSGSDAGGPATHHYDPERSAGQRQGRAGGLGGVSSSHLPQHPASKDGLQGTRLVYSDMLMETVSSNTSAAVGMLQKTLKILFKLLRIDMQTAYFFMNNSILLTELFSYFHISQSWRIRKTKQRLFCIKFLTPSWLCLVLAMCWENLCECTVLMIMKHWWKMPPDIFLYSYLDSQWLCISIMWNIFLWWKKGAKEVEPSNWKKGWLYD